MLASSYRSAASSRSTASRQQRLGVAPAAVDGREREARCFPRGDCRRPELGFGRTAEPRQLGVSCRRCRTQLGSRTEAQPVGVGGEVTQRAHPPIDIAAGATAVGGAQSDKSQPRDHLTVRRALHALVDDGGNCSRVSAAPCSFGQAAEQQPVETPVAEPQRVGADELEAIPGPIELAAVDVQLGGHHQLNDPVEPLWIEVPEQLGGLRPAAQLVAITSGDGIEHPGQHGHRRRPRRRCVGGRRVDQLGAPALGDEEPPEMTMDPGDVGDVGAADGEVERAMQLTQSAGQITGRRQRHAERMASVTLVGGRVGGDGDGDCLGGASGRQLGLIESVEGVGSRRQHASPSRGWRLDRDEGDCLLVGIEGIVVAAALQQTPPTSLVEDRGAGGVMLQIGVGEGVGDQLRSAVEVPGAAGDVGGPIDDLCSGHRQVGSLCILVGIERRQQPVVVALGLRQRIRQLGIDRGRQGGGHGAVVATRRRPVVDESGRPPGPDEAVVEVDRPGKGAVHGGPLTREQLTEHRFVDEGVTKRVPLLVDEQEVVLTCQRGARRRARRWAARPPRPTDDGRSGDRRSPRRARRAGRSCRDDRDGPGAIRGAPAGSSPARTRRPALRRRTGCRRSVRAPR